MSKRRSHEPYWARFVPSWKEPPPYNPPSYHYVRTNPCDNCTWSSDMCDNCPYGK